MSRGEVDIISSCQGGDRGTSAPSGGWPRRPSAAELFARRASPTMSVCCGLETVRLSGFVAEKAPDRGSLACFDWRPTRRPPFEHRAVASELLSHSRKQCFINEYVYAQSDEKSGKWRPCASLCRRSSTRKQHSAVPVGVIAAYNACISAMADSLAQ